SHVTLQGHLQPAMATPGSLVRLNITAEPADGWHIYALAPTDPKDVSKPTLITLTSPPGCERCSAQPSAPPMERQSTVNQAGKELFYDQPVTWTITVRVPDTAKPGRHPIEGIIGFQTCKDTGCDMPSAAKFSAEINVGEVAGGNAPLAFSSAKYAE